MGISFGTKRQNIGMGYFSFETFRVEVAKAISPEFGEAYQSYIRDTILAIDEKRREGLRAKFNEYLKTVNVEDSILDFLFQSDGEGKVNYKTARKLRDLCLKSKSTAKFGYVCDQRDMKEIAEIFDDAVKHRCNVKWY